MTLLFQVMVVSVLAAAMPALRCCASDSELAAAAVEAIRVTSSEDLQLTSTRRALHRLLMICKAYDVVVDIWVSIPTTAAVDDLTVLRTPRGEWKFLCLFGRLRLNSLASS